MQNLISPKKAILLSSIGKSILGVYSDTVASDRKIILKKEGIALGNASASYAIESTHRFVANNVALEMETGTLTEKKEVGVRIISNRKNPAFVDNSEFYATSKFYGKNFKIGTTEEQMLDEIVTQITNDAGISERGNGAIASARKAYTVSDAANNDDSTITVTLADGSSVTVTGSAHAANQVATAFNTDSNVNTLLRCFVLAADKFLITSIEPGYLFSVAAGTDTTVDKKELLLTAALDDNLIKVEADTDDFTRSSYNLAVIASSDYAKAANLHLIYNDGTTSAIYEVTAATNIATQQAAIIALGSTGKFFASNDGTSILLSSPVANYGFDIDFPFVNTAKTAPFVTYYSITEITSPKGRFSSLTADDVQRTFATVDHAGAKADAIRKTQTVAGADYTKISLSCKKNTPALEGASHQTSYLSELVIYVQKDLLRADLWNASNYKEDSGATKDANIIELLEEWV